MNSELIDSSCRTSETFLREAIALFYTTESSDPAIISNGFSRWAEFEAFISSVFPRYLVRSPSYSASDIINSGLQSILSINSVSIGINSSTHLSGPSRVAISPNLEIECILALGSSLLRSSMRRATVEMASTSSASLCLSWLSSTPYALTMIELKWR